MKLKSSIALSENGFVFNAETGESFALNPAGLTLLQLLREGKSEAELLHQMLDEFDTTREIAERDIHDFIQSLVRLQLITP